MTSNAPPALPERALRAAMNRAGISVLHQAQDRRFDLAENLPAQWPNGSALGSVILDIFPNQLGQDLDDALTLCVETKREQALTFTLGDEGQRRHYQARLLPDETGTTTIITDITDQHTREIALASLLREVSHRSKNLLAIVQSVAMQTAHHSEGIQDFLDKFRGRLHALSSTQDLVTESNWRGSHFHALFTSQLARVGRVASSNVHLHGDDPLLGPNASLYIGLAIHELASNAALHGSLSEEHPQEIGATATIVATGELVFEWSEPPPAQKLAIARPRFGSLVLQRIVPLSVGGSAELSIDQDGVHYTLRIPGNQFEQ